jgi:beta-glucanase (GH16 family)
VTFTHRLSAVLLVAAACTREAPRAERAESAAVRRDSAAVVFFDDFDAPALDRTRWNVEVWTHTVNDELQAYVDTSATIYLARGDSAEGAENGALVLHPRWKPGAAVDRGRRLDFISGRIMTQGKVEFTYGTAAARMKLPAGEGLWPAFWALGGGDWPATGEIDIMENVGEADWASVALHGPGYSGDTPLFNRHYFPPGQDATGWHVYSVEWLPDELIFRVDSALVYRATRPMVENYGRWAFDNPKYLILNFALGGAFPVKVNGVRAPYTGMPDATVARIKAGEVKVLVDWVRITRP